LVPPTDAVSGGAR
jgi:hypothetical protein